jgi:hypothetical protein
VRRDAYCRSLRLTQVEEDAGVLKIAIVQKLDAERGTILGNLFRVTEFRETILSSDYRRIVIVPNEFRG